MRSSAGSAPLQKQPRSSVWRRWAARFALIARGLPGAGTRGRNGCAATRLNEVVDARRSLTRCLVECGLGVLTQRGAIGDHSDPVWVRVLKRAGHTLMIRRLGTELQSQILTSWSRSARSTVLKMPGACISASSKIELPEGPVVVSVAAPTITRSL